MGILDKLKKVKKWATLGNLILLILFGSLFYILRFSLTGELIATGDTPGHYYLCQKMLEYLQYFQLSGYDYNWFGGFPAFFFYNPLPYLSVCLLHLVSFKLIPLLTCFNLVLFCLPILFLVSVYYTSSAFFEDKKTNILSVCIAYIVLLNYTANNFGVGIVAQYLNGFFTNAFAWPMLIFLIGTLEKLRKSHKKKYSILSTILLSGIILSHIFTAIFAGIYILFFLLFYWKSTWKKILCIIVGSTIITSFWWVPFVLNIQYAAGDNGTGTLMGDPIIALYSQPILGVFLLFFSIIGIIRLLKEKKYILPTTFLICLIFLPREIIDQFINLPIHFYRVVGMLIVINIFIASYGFKYFFDNYFKLDGKNFVLKSAISWIFFIGLLIPIESHLNNKYFYGDIRSGDQKVNNSLRAIVDILKDNEDLVFFDTYISGNYSGHYVNKILTDNGQKLLGGLIYQSSLSANYYLLDEKIFSYECLIASVFNPYYNKNFTEKRQYPFENYYLGRAVGETDEKFGKEISQSIINLQQYGVKYILVSSDHRTPILDFAESSLNNNLIIIKKVSSPLVLLEINKEVRKSFASISYSPFLYIQDDIFALSFKNFSKGWYQNGYAIDYPVIYDTRKKADIYGTEYAQAGGYLLSTNSCPKEKINYLANKNKPVIVINASNDCYSENKNVIFINKQHQIDSHPEEDTQEKEDAVLKEKNDFYKKIYTVISSSSNRAEYENIFGSVSEKQLNFYSNSGTLIRYSYFPKWQSKNNRQAVFWMTPSFMFVFGEGNNEILYK